MIRPIEGTHCDGHKHGSPILLGITRLARPQPFAFNRVVPSPRPSCSFCPFFHAFVERASNLTSGFSFRHVLLQNLGPQGGCS